jgi:hypothetical protein
MGEKVCREACCDELMTVAVAPHQVNKKPQVCDPLNLHPLIILMKIYHTHYAHSYMCVLVYECFAYYYA